jgi:hypothetical protein
LLLLSATVLGCWGLTALVRRSAWLRPLFGLGPCPAKTPSLDAAARRGRAAF